MGNLKNVIYLSNEDYEILVTTGTVTIDGVTLTYDENNLYITPDDGSTSPVQTVNGQTGNVVVDVSSYTSSATGRIPYLDSAGLTFTSAAVTGSATFIQSISAGSGTFSASTKYLHPTTDTFIKSIDGGSGSFEASTKYLGATFAGTASTTASSTATTTVASSTHTHGYTPAGTVTLASGATTGSGVAYAYDISGAAYTPAGTITLAANNFTTKTFVTGVTAAGGEGSTKYLVFNAGTTPPSKATFSGTKTNALATGWSTTTKALYGSRTTSGTAGTAAYRRTLEIKGYELAFADYTPAGTITFTAGTAPTLIASTASNTGIKYLESFSVTGGTQIGTDSAYAGISTTMPTFTGTAATITPTLSMSKIYGTFSGTAGTTTSISGTVSVAASNHTHSFTASGTATLSSYSQTATGRITYIESASHSHTGATVTSSASAITTLSANTTNTSGDITYIESATHTHVVPTVTSSANAVTGISGGSLTKTDKYLDITATGD